VTTEYEIVGVVKNVTLAWLKVPLRLFDRPMWQPVKRRRHGRGSCMQVSLSKRTNFSFSSRFSQKLRKTTVGFVLFVRVEELGSHWTDFNEKFDISAFFSPRKFVLESTFH
jgi:hypothetical protein